MTSRLASLESQVHILVGCADARDVGQAHIDAVRVKIADYAARGIHVEFHSIRVPGTFVTEDVVDDIRRITAECEDISLPEGSEPAYYVHLQTHGVLEDDSVTGCGTRATHTLRVENGSPLNCGMLGATGVGIDMEALILAVKPTIPLRRGATLTIRDENDLRILLREVYHYDGFLAGDWVRSIDDLRTHVRRQKAVLERAISTDRDLRRLGFNVTANIHDYRHHRQIRLDCAEVEATFWDEVLEVVQERLREGDGAQRDQMAQDQKQAPVAGLFAMSDPTASPRDAAFYHYAETKPLPDTDTPYQPNTLFVLSGTAFDRPARPFGPYSLAGLFYAIEHLNVRDWMVLGREAGQTRRMQEKIAGDPLASLFIRELGVNLLPANTSDLTSARQRAGI